MENKQSALEPQYQAARMARLRRKLGLCTEREGDAALAEDLLQRTNANRADFTLTFRRLCDGLQHTHSGNVGQCLYAATLGGGPQTGRNPPPRRK